MSVQEIVSSIQQTQKRLLIWKFLLKFPYKLNPHGHETSLFCALFKVENKINIQICHKSMKLQLSMDNNS